MYAKNEVNRSNGSKVIIRADTQCIKLELFHYCDRELDPMTFISEHDLDIVVTYLHAKNEVKWFKSYHSDRHTDRQSRVKPPTFLLLQVVITRKMFVLVRN